MKNWIKAGRFMIIPLLISMGIAIYKEMYEWLLVFVIPLALCVSLTSPFFWKEYRKQRGDGK